MLVFLALGPVTWALHLTLLYASQSTMCALGVGVAPDGSSGVVTGVAAAIVVVTAGLLAVAIIKARSVLGRLAGGSVSGDYAEFAVGVMRVLSALSLVAMLYTGMALAVLRGCATGR